MPDLTMDLEASLEATTPKECRDPDFHCESFTLKPLVLQSPDCEGDGHYMCLHCKRFDKESRYA